MCVSKILSLAKRPFRQVGVDVCACQTCSPVACLK